MAATPHLPRETIVTLPFNKIMSIFPCYPGPGWSQRLIYVSLALLIGVFEVIGFNLGTKSLPQMAILLMFMLLLAAGGWFAPWAEVAYVVAFDILAFLPISNQFAFLTFGVCAIAVSWIVRSWVIPGMVLFISTEIILLITTVSPTAQVMSFILDVVIVLPLGFFLRWNQQRLARGAEELQYARQEAEEVSLKIRQDLATELHDTIAKDLVRLVVITDRLVKHPDSASPKDFQLLSEISTVASRRIRPIIMNLDSTRKRMSLSEVVSDSGKMLRTRDMTLEKDVPAEIDSLLTRQQLLLASLVVRESATNALKYAPKGTKVSLVMDIDENRVLNITLRNPIAESPDYSGVTGGFGLHNLESKLNEEDGELFFGKDPQGWVIKAAIPPSPGRGK